MRLTGIALLTAFCALLFVVAAVPVHAGPIVTDEAGLSATGTPYQVNLAPDGALLVSIDGTNEIWRIDPNTGAYTIYRAQYPDVTDLSDAHGDAVGNIWFAGWSDGLLGRIAGGSLTRWDLPSDYPWGIAVDAGGRVWVTDAATGALYRFKPGSGVSGQLTCYFLPSGGVSTYVLAGAGDLWLGDALNGRILRVPLDDAGNPGQAEVWEVPGAEPEGMALDAGGRLWWADPGLDRLARLTPGDPASLDSDPVTLYAPPVAGSNPLVVQIGGDAVWYTDGSTITQSGIGTSGWLDPAAAVGDVISAGAGTASLIESPACGGAVNGRTAQLAISGGSLSWSTTLWAGVVEGGGWSIHRLPAGGNPYGIALVGGSPWVVDQGRRVLARPGAEPLRTSYLPLVTR
jgi:streptogramin lyase